MRRLSQRLIAAVLALTMLLGGLEAFLRLMPAPAVAASGDPVGYIPQVIYLPGIGARPNPLYEGHDAAGWRNAKVAGDVDIVALGASHTYGVGADREGAWPQRLSHYLDRSVYQMAFGGYSVVQLLRLMPEVLTHHPKHIVVEIYLGANFTSANDNVYYQRPTPDTRALENPDLSVVRAINRARYLDGRGWLRNSYLDCQSPRSAPEPALQAVSGILHSPPLRELLDAADTRARLPEALSRSLVFTELHSRVEQARLRVDVIPPPPMCITINGPVQTILSPSYRLIALDDTDPRIVEGERITIAAVKRIRDIGMANGATVSVLLIPTKEMAFHDLMAAKPPAGSEHLIRLWDLETKSTARMKAAFQAFGIPTFDALPTLASMIVAGVDPYLGLSANGHESAVGYDAIAKDLAAFLRTN